ncbi:MAG: aminoglycoside phosphotransferase family protein [Pseudonocardiaceae bacterium]
MSDINPVDPAAEPVRRVVNDINQAHGLRFAVYGRCPGGLSGGAWILTAPDGRRAVLKWRANDPTARKARLMPLVNRIHATGYPTPRWIAAGITDSATSYHLQEFVPGQTASPLNAEVAALLIDVIERQAGLDPDPCHDCSHRVTSYVQDESDDGARAFIRGLGEHGWDLLAHFDRLLALHGPVQLPAGDLVHGDFNSCNALIHAGQVSGVMDIEQFGSGTRVIDYGWLLREAYLEDAGQNAARLIRRAGEAVAGPGALALCVTATAFDKVWFRANRIPQSLPRVLAGLHQLADDLSKPL